MRTPRSFIFTVSIISFLGGCEVDPSTIQGEVRLTINSATVSQYLTAHPADSGFVHAYSISNNIFIGLTALDTSVASSPVLGEFTLDVLVATAAITQLRLRIPTLTLNGGPTDPKGPTYAFGPYRFTAPNQHLVPPFSGGETVQNADIEECPAMAEVTVRLVGATEDLDLLDDPAIFGVSAFVEEEPGTAEFGHQASSAVKIALLSELRGTDGKVVDILFRSGLPVQFGALIGATSDDPGFASVLPLDADLPFPNLPTGDWKPFAAQTTTSVTADCGEILTGIEIEIDAERIAGNLMGKVDVIGRNEEIVDVEVDPLGLDHVMTFSPAAAGPHDFLIEAIPGGDYEVKAQLLLEGSRSIVKFPDLTGEQIVTIELDDTMNAGAAFISPFHTLHARFRFIDTGPDSALQFVVEEDFNDLTPISYENDPGAPINS